MRPIEMLQGKHDQTDTVGQCKSAIESCSVPGPQPACAMLLLPLCNCLGEAANPAAVHKQTAIDSLESKTACRYSRLARMGEMLSMGSMLGHA